MIASHYVIDEIIESMGKSNASETFKKFADRYVNDKDLLEIYELFSNAEENAEEVKKRLVALKNLRQTESSGGSNDLPMSDRRHFK